MTTLRRVMTIDDDNPVEGDLWLSPTGQSELIGDAAANRPLEVQQAIRGRLRFFLGEWFLDARQGFPYFRDVFIKSPNHASIVSSLRRTIVTTAGVSFVDRLTLSVGADRTANVSFRAFIADVSEPLVFEDFILGAF